MWKSSKYTIADTIEYVQVLDGKDNKEFCWEKYRTIFSFKKEKEKGKETLKKTNFQELTKDALDQELCLTNTTDK